MHIGYKVAFAEQSAPLILPTHALPAHCLIRVVTSWLHAFGSQRTISSMQRCVLNSEHASIDATIYKTIYKCISYSLYNLSPEEVIVVKSSRFLDTCSHGVHWLRQ